LNIYLQSNWSPYRLYHLTDNKLSLGRIYGGPLDTKVSNIYKPLLKINETYTISLDIKSCFTQLFVLENCKNIDNNQDFYYYNSLDGILTRSDIKQITQNLIFCNERMTAYRAYVRKQTENKSVYTRIPTYQEFSNFVELMINERRYLKKLFNQRDMTKEIFHIESNLMIPISNNLMDTGINHITLFDAIYIPYNNLQQSLDIIRDISKQKYNKEINLDYNKSIYNSLL